MNAPTTRVRERKLCGQCEYFDAAYGDCLNHYSDRFQTTAVSFACSAFYPDTSDQQDETC